MKIVGESVLFVALIVIICRPIGGQPSTCNCDTYGLSTDVEHEEKYSADGPCSLELISCGTGYKVDGGPSVLYCDHEDGRWKSGDVAYELSDYACEINLESVAIAAAVMFVIILLFIAIVIFAVRNFNKKRRPTRALPNDYTNMAIGGDPDSIAVDMYQHSPHYQGSLNHVIKPKSETMDYAYSDVNMGNHVDYEPEFTDEYLGGTAAYASLPYSKKDGNNPQNTDGAATDTIDDSHDPATSHVESASALYATVNTGVKSASSSHSENINEHEEIPTESQDTETPPPPPPPPAPEDPSALYAVVQKKNKVLQSKYERPSDLVTTGSVKNRINMFSSPENPSGSKRIPPDVKPKTKSIRNRFVDTDSNNLSLTTVAPVSSTQPMESVKEDNVSSTQEQTSSQSPSSPPPPEEDDIPPPPSVSPPPPPIDDPPPPPPLEPPPPPPTEPPPSRPPPEMSDNWHMQAQPTRRINRAERPASTGDILSDKSRKAKAGKDLRQRQGNSFREHNGRAQSGNLKRPQRAKTAHGSRYTPNSTITSNASSGRVKFQNDKKLSRQGSSVGRFKDWLMKDLSVPDKKKKKGSTKSRSESMRSRDGSTRSRESSVRSQQRNVNSRDNSVKSHESSRRQQGPVARATNNAAIRD